MSYFKFEDKNVYYEETGCGKPLLLLHGNTASSNMFGAVASGYAQDHRVILMDFLGHGQSDRLDKFPADLWFYEAEQVIAFLKEKQYDLKEESAVKSDYYLNTNHEYEVRCQIMENGFNLIDLKLAVPTEKEAETIASRWTAQSQEVYALLLSKLL